MLESNEDIRGSTLADIHRQHSCVQSFLNIFNAVFPLFLPDIKDENIYLVTINIIA